MRRHGWAHHIQRLMVLGNWALQRGYDPVELNDWFVDMFVDGTPWVMPANVIGMSQHADGGIVATKPYASGGAYIDKMSDYCGGAGSTRKVRLGEDACPFTAGYWAFLDRAEPRIRQTPAWRSRSPGCADWPTARRRRPGAHPRTVVIGAVVQPSRDPSTGGERVARLGT